MGNVYIVHNAFSVSLALTFSESNEDVLLVARGRPCDIIPDRCDGAFGQFLVLYYCGFLPSFNVVVSIFQAKSVYVSSVYHKRMMFLWPLINVFGKRVVVFDEGVASINSRFYLRLTQGWSFALRLWFDFLIKGKSFSFETIFDRGFLSREFLDRCKISEIKCVSGRVKAASSSVGLFAEKYSTEYRGQAIILGNAEVFSSDIFEQVKENFSNGVAVKLKDHPLKKGRDDLGSAPEFYVAKNRGDVQCVYAAGSSALFTIKILFPEIKCVHVLFGGIEEFVDEEVFRAFDIGIIRV